MPGRLSRFVMASAVCMVTLAGALIGIMGIIGIIGIMRGWRHEITRWFAEFCSETVQVCCAAVKYHQQAGARGGSGV